MNIKLTEKDKIEILKALTQGHSVKSLAARFGVSTQTIKRLKGTLNVPIRNISNVSKESQRPKTVVEMYSSSTTSPDIEDLAEFLDRLKPELIRRTLEVIDNPDRRTSDQLKAIDMLAKWSGLYWGGEEKIQREIRRQTEAALESELSLMFERIIDDDMLSDEAKDRMLQICQQLPLEAS